MRLVWVLNERYCDGFSEVTGVCFGKNRKNLHEESKRRTRRRENTKENTLVIVQQ